MSDLGDISRAIGSLEAKVESGVDQRKTIFEKLDKIGEKLDVITELRNDHNNLDRRVKKIEPVVEDFKRLKQRGLGIAAGVTMAAGALGASAKEIWQSMFK